MWYTVCRLEFDCEGTIGGNTMKQTKKWLIWIGCLFLVTVMIGGCGFKKVKKERVESAKGGIKKTEGNITGSINQMTFPEKVVELPEGYLFYQDPDTTYSTDEILSQDWESSDPDIVEVDRETGDITVVSNDSQKEVTISVVQILEDGSEVKGAYKVMVQQRIKELTLVSAAKALSVGTKVKIHVNTNPVSIKNSDLVWNSSNSEYAIVTAEGVVKAKEAGAGKSVTITAKTTDGSQLEQSIEFQILDPNKPMVALTFDDGPSYESTKIIVDTLKEYNAHATFFVLGEHLTESETKNRELLKESFENGNEIANHTYDHKQLTLLSIQQMQQETTSTSDLVKEITGQETKLLRPPYGASNSTVESTLQYPFILWSVDTLDWKTRNTNSTIQSVLNGARDGAVILMHDIHMPTAEAVKVIVPELVSRGYQLVTVSELAQAKGITLENGKRYGSIHSNS